MLLSRRSRAEVSNDASRQQRRTDVRLRLLLLLILMAFCSFVGGEIYTGLFEPGIYVCSKCGHELFSSQAKYEHSSPWPAFTKTIHPDSVSKRKEGKHALKVSCGKCGNGLGHEFLGDGPKAVKGTLVDKSYELGTGFLSVESCSLPENAMQLGIRSLGKLEQRLPYICIFVG